MGTNVSWVNYNVVLFSLFLAC
uniref:Uncharacterized protein n=1 Tax=Rhizophora mucronata TaxID=61149 RepID=A0A2P2KD96_RHIMU